MACTGVAGTFDGKLELRYEAAFAKFRELCDCSQAPLPTLAAVPPASPRPTLPLRRAQPGLGRGVREAYGASLPKVPGASPRSSGAAGSDAVVGQVYGQVLSPGRDGSGYAPRPPAGSPRRPPRRGYDVGSSSPPAGPGADDGPSPLAAPASVHLPSLPALQSLSSPGASRSLVAGASLSSRKRAVMPGLVVDGEAARSAYNFIDPVVAGDLEAQLVQLTRQHEGVEPDEATGVYVVLERCHSCSENHALSMRHDEEEYESRARGCLAHVLRAVDKVVLGASELLCRLEANPRCLGTNYGLGHDVWHHGSRMGAFEVYLLTPQAEPCEGSDGSVVPELALPRSMFGGAAGSDDAPAVASGDGAGKTWGAQLQLPCGYVTTLLHSKLSSNSWPGRAQLSRRLLTSMPLGSVAVRVECPTGATLPGFTLEVLAQASPMLGGQPSPDDSPGGREGHSCVASAQVSGAICHVRGVPIGSSLGLRIVRPATRPGAVRFVTARLRSSFTFGADISFFLWQMEVPGGLDIFAASELLDASQLHPSLRPMRGEVEIESGEKLQVQGRVRLPWRGFCADREGVLAVPVTTEAGGAAFLGKSCDRSLGLQLPSKRQIQRCLPEEVSSPQKVLEASPWHAVLEDYSAVLQELQRLADEEPAGRVTVPPSEFPVMERLLETGCQYVEAFRNAAVSHWVGVNAGAGAEEDAIGPYDEAHESVSQELGFSDVAAACAEAQQGPRAQEVRRKLERAARSNASRSRGSRLAAAYVAAAGTRSWLRTLCCDLAAATESQIVFGALKGSGGSTRALEDVVLQGDAWPRDLARCKLVCNSMQHVLQTLSAVLAAVTGETSAVALVACEDDFSPQSPRRPGRVSLTVLWKRAEQGGEEADAAPTALSAPHLAEIQIAHEAFEELADNPECSLLEDTRFFFEVCAARSLTASREVETVAAFAGLRRLWVRGYKPSLLDEEARSTTMEVLRRRGSMVVAKLVAYTATIEVVMPGELIPLEDVSIEVVGEKQGKTDKCGRFELPLRPGDRMLKLRHSAFRAGWAEVTLSVSSISPRFYVPMPLTLVVWRSPVLVRGKVLAWQVWVAGRAAAGPALDDDDGGPGRGSEPYSGALVGCRSGRIEVSNGRLVLEAGLVTTLQGDGEVEPQPNQDPLGALALEGPYARPRPRLDPFAGQDWSPRLLGTRLEEPLLAEGQLAQPSDVVVCARTRCCGCGVPGVLAQRAPSSTASSSTGRGSDGEGEAATATEADGVCVLSRGAAGQSLGNRTLRLSHSALRDGEEEYIVSSGVGVEGSISERPAELPVFFEPCVHLITVEEDGGRKALQAFAGGTEPVPIPLGARAFCGRLLGQDGRQWDCAAPPPGSSRVDAGRSGGDDDEDRDLDRETTRPLVLPTSRLRAGNACPVSTVLGATPEEWGFEWRPAPPEPEQAGADCGLRLLLQGALTLGVLRPVATVVAADGTELRLAIEDFPTAQALGARAAELLGCGGRAGRRGPGLALERDDQVLEADDAIGPGDRLRILCRLCVTVTFGHSSVGIPRAQVRLLPGGGGPPAPRHLAATDVAGDCDVVGSAGDYTLVVSHPLLDGGKREVQVSLVEPLTSLGVEAPARVYVFTSSTDGDADSVADLSVLLCADPRSAPPSALPAAGVAHVEDRVVELTRSEAVAIELQAPQAGAQSDDGSDSGVAQGLLSGFRLDLETEDLIWEPDPGVDLDLPGVVGDLLAGPVRVGLLRVAVCVRLHAVEGPSTTQKLPASEWRRASDILGAALQVGPAPPHEEQELRLFLRQRLLSDDEEVPPRSTVDIWPMALVTVDVCTQCCRSGVADVPVNLEQDGVTTDALTFEGVTDASGSCRMVACAGEHRVHLAHPLLSGCAEASQDGRLALATKGRRAKPYSMSVVASVALFVYAVPDGTGLAIYLACHVEDAPADARAASGTLRLAGDGGALRVAPDAAGVSRVVLPSTFGRPRSSAGAQVATECPLGGLAFDADASELLAWSPADGLASANCVFTALATGALLAGALRPAVLVRCDGNAAAPLRLPAALGTVAALLARVAEELEKDEEDIAIYPVVQPSGASPPPLDGSVRLQAGQEFAVGEFTALVVEVLLFEGIVDEDIGMPGVVVEVDGRPAGKTDDAGRAELSVRAGARAVRLVHSCFGAAGRLLPTVEAQPGGGNEVRAVADIRLFFYATEPEVFDDEDAEVEEAPAADPVVVWVTGSRESIPDDAIFVDGRASATGALGAQVAATLSAGAPAELLLLAGEAADADAGGSSSVRVESLSLETWKEGYIWRAKDPSPLAERAEELGGSEYLRLLECPVVMGFLEPAFKVVRGGEVLKELTLASNGTAADVKATIGNLLGVASSRLLLYRAGEQLLDDAFMLPFAEVEAVEVAEVMLRTVSGCCCETIPNVEVLLDGAVVGSTDDHGALIWDAPVGAHEVSVRHHALGDRGGIELVVSGKGVANAIVVPLDPRLYIYATEPDADEEEEEADEEEAEPLYDPSCVWVAADPEQVPDDAGPLDGRAAWASASGRGAAATLGAEAIAPFVLRYGRCAPRSAGGVCPLASLRLRCGRQGFCWKPKEPSPLEVRAEDLGGCELLRLLECAAALGFLKPAATVQCASGESFLLPLDTYGEVRALREELAERLGEAAEALQLASAEEAPISGAYLPPPAKGGRCEVLCARPGEHLCAARQALETRRGRGEVRGQELWALSSAADGAEEAQDVEEIPVDRAAALPGRPRPP